MDDSSYHVINLFQIGESHHTVDCSPRVTALGDSEEHDNARRDSRVRYTLRLSHWQDGCTVFEQRSLQLCYPCSVSRLIPD